MFEVDRENSVVSMTGQGKGNMPLKTARCLEHALRVCRENDFQARSEDFRSRILTISIRVGCNVKKGKERDCVSNGKCVLAM